MDEMDEAMYSEENEDKALHMKFDAVKKVWCIINSMGIEVGTGTTIEKARKEVLGKIA